MGMGFNRDLTRHDLKTHPHPNPPLESEGTGCLHVWILVLIVTTPQRQTNTIMKLITWNIQWGRGADGRVDLDRIVAHAKKFSDFDVICLQEVACAYAELPGNDMRDQFKE